MHELQDRDSVVLADHVGDSLEARDELVIPDGHHADVALTLATRVGVSTLGGDDAGAPAGLSLHVGHFLVGDVAVGVVEVGLGRGVLDAVLGLELSEPARREDVRVFFLSGKHLILLRSGPGTLETRLTIAD
jgi:hypothetical protein